MPKSFPGFSPKVITFFKQLEKNNTREWFTPRKAQFEELLREPMLELVSQVCDDLRGFAVDHVNDPAKAVLRIYRDTRFSKDKTPYKTQLAAHFPRAGLPKFTGASLYFSVSHKGVEVAGGMYMPGPPQLKAIREAICADEPGFRKQIGARALCAALGAMQGEQLARVPKGYAADHSAGDLLRRKQFYFYTTLAAEIATGPELRKEIVRRFRLVAPFVEYVNQILLSELHEDEAAAEPIPKRPKPMF